MALGDLPKGEVLRVSQVGMTNILAQNVRGIRSCLNGIRKTGITNTCRCMDNRFYNFVPDSIYLCTYIHSQLERGFLLFWYLHRNAHKTKVLIKTPNNFFCKKVKMGRKTRSFILISNTIAKNCI